MNRSARLLTKTFAACVLFVLAYAGPGATAEMMGSGTVTYVVEQVGQFGLPGGRHLVESRLKGVILANDAGSPLHLSAQDCGGAAVADAKGGMTEDAGVCAAIDKDGDIWWLWYNNKGDRRTWSVISGTGKYAGMTGGGTTKILTATADGRLTIMWSGTLKMK